MSEDTRSSLIGNNNDLQTKEHHYHPPQPHLEQLNNHLHNQKAKLEYSCDDHNVIVNSSISNNIDVPDLLVSGDEFRTKLKLESLNAVEGNVVDSRTLTVDGNGDGGGKNLVVETLSMKSLLRKNSHDRDIDVFIMSEAGKPIYCYSEREDIITLMGVCVAMVNYVYKTQNDQLRSIHTSNGLHINFAVRSPLVIVVICRQHSCFDEQTLINQINAQIITTITLKALKSIFQQAPTYDLKRLIHNNELKTMDILVQSITSPIAELFSTYKNRRNRSNLHLFNNVISFYTSTTIAAPRTTLSLSASGSGSSLNQIGSPNSASTSNNSNQIVVHDNKPNVLSRVYVPIAIIPAPLREQMTSIINTTVSSFSDIVFTILFLIEKEEANLPSAGHSTAAFESNLSPSNHPINSSDDEFIDATDELSSSGTFSSYDELLRSQQTNGPNPGDDTLQNLFQTSMESDASRRNSHNTNKNLKLLSVCNHTAKFRINPLDIQLIYALIKASDNQLSSTESLWLPLCLSRVDSNRFLYAHISYLLDEKYCLVLLDVDHGDFQLCQQAKETIESKLDNIRFTEPIGSLRSCISELDQPHLQYICHQTPRHCMMWQSSIQTEFSSLNYYLIDRMQRSSLKTLWLRNSRHQCALLGWHTATFQLYAQFDITVTQYEALDTVQSFIKWFKKEEDKLTIKDC